MKVLGIIGEYNPFHCGHKYHIEKSKEITGADFVIAIMSGNFVQRGEPAIVDKWSRALMALNNGCDLVIELPLIYSISTAESFAQGSTRLMDSLNIVDCLCFGGESDDLELLSKIAKELSHPSEDFKSILNENLKSGLSYAAARSKSVGIYFQDDSIANVISSPNNILAIEYLKSIYINELKLEPYVIKRVGGDYGSMELDKVFSSASSIRKNIFQEGLSSIQTHVPEESFNILKDFSTYYGAFNRMENFSPSLIYRLVNLDENSILNYPYTNNGTGLRILNNFENYNLEEIILKSVSKTHTRTRIQRILMNILLDIKEEEFQKMDKEHPNYIRVLASNENGFKLISAIKKRSNLPIITKVSNYKNLENFNSSCLLKDLHGTDIYFSPFPRASKNLDFYKNMAIKKE